MLRSKFTLLAIAFGVQLLAPTATNAAEILTRTLTTTEKICGELGCFDMAPGEVGIYKNEFLNNPLAYGTLAHDVDLEGVKIKAGTRISFYDSANRDFYGMDFKIRLLKETVIAGVTFASDSEVAFDRFFDVYNQDLKKWIWVPHPMGMVRVAGKLNAQSSIQGVPLSAGSEIRFQSHIFHLSDGDTKTCRLLAGMVAEESTFPAPRPI